jgi:ABC-type transport system involved in cytochrome bd biosynthesis fused ATPase/permease subunit
VQPTPQVDPEDPKLHRPAVRHGIVPRAALLERLRSSRTRRSSVLVLNEPTTNLDLDNAQAVIADALAGAERRSVVLITHGSEGLDTVDEIVTLRRGRIVPRDDEGGSMLERGGPRP